MTHTRSHSDGHTAKEQRVHIAPTAHNYYRLIAIYQALCTRASEMTRLFIGAVVIVLVCGPDLLGLGFPF